MSDESTPSKARPQIEVLVCPRCDTYFGSSSRASMFQDNIRSSMRNLADEDPSNWGSVTGQKSECQRCHQPRELVTYVRLDLVGPTIIEQAEKAKSKAEAGA